MSIRLIRSTNSDPVTVYDDAVVFHSAKGHDYTGDKRGGVFEKVYSGFNGYLDKTQGNLIIQSGMGMLYGRQFELPQNETKEIPYSTGQYLIAYVRLEVTASTESISIEYTYSSLSWPSIGNTDLIRNRTGVATMELYRVNATGGAVTLIDRRYIYRPGYAEKARMMTEDGIINGRKVKDLIYNNKDQVKVTDRAYYADRADSLGSTTTSVTRNKIDDNLYMKNRDAYLVTSKIYTLKTSGVWQNGQTYTVNEICDSLTATVIHATVIGSDNYANTGFALTSAINGSSRPSFSLVASRVADSGQNAAELSIEVANGRATCKPLGNDVNGALYLVVMMIGG